MFEKALSREGIVFESFESAQDALDALHDGPPQVLVSDIRMPGPSGLELLQVVKQRFPATPVIVMTAYSDLESAVAAFQGGAYEYLLKPFDVDQAVDLDRLRSRMSDERRLMLGVSDGAKAAVLAALARDAAIPIFIIVPRPQHADALVDVRM